MSIIIATVVLGGMGLVFGVLIAVASNRLAVPVDERLIAIRDMLPGVNCGACGYPGCDGYASAIAAGEAPINACPVGGDSLSDSLGKFLGVTAEHAVRMVATVMCRGDVTRCKVKYDYNGPKDCRSAALVADGDKACAHACLGLGCCERACPFGAITINENRLAEVDEDKCKACEKCIIACPRGVLKMMPAGNPVHRTCSAMERGKVVRDNCTAGCIGCGKCARSCKFGAIEMVNNLPDIDLSKCVACMCCADVCPTGAIKSNESKRKLAVIHVNECIGCGECSKVCQFEAIQGNEGEKHNVISWNCVGCSACAEVCPTHCIEMVHVPKLHN